MVIVSTSKIPYSKERNESLNAEGERDFTKNSRSNLKHQKVTLKNKTKKTTFNLNL